VTRTRPGRPGRPGRPPGAFGPDAVEVRPRTLRAGDGVCASFAVTGYPAEVPLGWLEPLIADPGRLDVSLHIEPVPPQVAATRLRHQLARLESSSRTARAAGRLADFEAEAAADDAADLAAQLARGQGRLFRAGLYFTVHARDEEDLQAESERVRALAASMLLDARPASWRSLQGWVTTLPLATDALQLRRTMDTSALAASFPFTSADLSAGASSATAVLYGLNTASSSLVMWDRWACDNYNCVILARSGSGKSYLAKLELLRSAYAGIEAIVIDPEDEYARLCQASGGTLIRPGQAGVRINPLDLPPAADGPDTLIRRALFTHTLTAVLLGEQPGPAERAALDTAVIQAYERSGITSDPATWNRPAPLLRDLAQALAGSDDPAGRGLAARLAPYVTGSWRGLFDGPSTVRPGGHLVVWSLRDLAEELRPLGTLLTLDATWQRVTSPRDRRPRLVVVDEGWLLMQQPDSARWLFRLAKSARKHWAGLTVVTQDAADVLGSPLGQAVVANAATQILMRQSPQAIDQVTEAFGLSAGERAFLLSAGRGQALLAAGTSRAGFEAIASPAEHQLVTTDPAELAQLGDPEGEHPW
jgi:type IV secretory pathway VirB4 component